MTEIDARAFRDALSRFATGVTVVAAAGPQGPEGMTANSFSALSLDPPLVLWCIRCESPSRPVFERASHFAVNVLGLGQRTLSARFATPSADKFAGVDWAPGLGGAPVLAGAIASFECARWRIVDGGDHRIVVGRVERFASADGEPLVFSAGRYARAIPEAIGPGDPAVVAEFADLLL